MLHLFIIGVTASLALLGHANHHPAYKLKPALPALRTAQPDPLTVQIPIDHFSNGSKTFANRYWINSTYYQSGGPVFLLDVGEQTVTDDFVQAYLMEVYGQSVAMQLALKYHGMAVLLEHRFYGQSLPFPIDKNTGLAPAGYDAYQYLTVEQALEDVVYLAEHFQPAGHDSDWSALQPSQTPWVFIGGSYPGDRAAWIRIRNPDVVYASWASSAPVQTSVDMPTYFTQVYADMTANCSADMAAASGYITQILTSGSARDRAIVTLMSNLAAAPTNISHYTGQSDTTIENEFEGASTTDYDIAYNLANFITEDFQSNGFDYATLPFCSLIERFDPAQIKNNSISNIITSTFKNTHDLRPTTQGIGATYGGQAAFLAMMFGIYAQSAQSLDTSTSNSTGSTADANSWTWQTCTDLGYFQVAAPSSPHNLLSSFINETSWERSNCQAIFPYSQLPSLPNTKALVDRYGGWNMNPSQVMFTNGLDDPWHTLSVQSTSTEIGAPNRRTTQTVPECGRPANGTDVFGVTYRNGYHAGDLQAAQLVLEPGFMLFAAAMDKWLPCFQKHSITSNTTTGIPSTTSTSSSQSATKTGGAETIFASRMQLGSIAVVIAAVLLV